MSKKKSRLSEIYGGITFNREKLTSGTAYNYIYYLHSNLEHCIYMIDYINLLYTCVCSEIVDDVQPEQSDEPVDENEDLVNDGVHVLDEDLYEYI